jgi:hypothetical protein
MRASWPARRLWQAVYDPEPPEEPLPGSIMGMGIEVGIKARLLWPGGVLIDTEYDDYAEAMRRTKALIANPTVPAIFEAALVYNDVLIRVDALERLPDARLGQPDGISPSRMAEMVEIDKAGSKVRC